MVQRDKYEANDTTPFDESKLQDLETIKHYLLHAKFGSNVRPPMAQLPDAIFKTLQDGADLGKLGAIAEIIAARGSFETLGIHETAQDNDIQTNAAEIINANNSAAYAVSLAKQAASGSPRGVFANAAELKAKYPNGADGIWVTNDNNHWWFYNKGWINGGIYQSTTSNFSDLEKTGINLLKGTSNAPQTIKVTDKRTTASSNGLKLQLDAGKTYVYSANLIERPDVSLRISIQGVRSDGSYAWGNSNLIQSIGRKFIRFTIPDVSVDHTEVGIFLGEAANNYTVTLSEEALVCASYAYPWMPNPDEYDNSQNEQTLYEVNQCRSLLRLLFTNQSNINLLNGTSEELTTFVDSGWGQFSQAKPGGYYFYDALYGATYTYSAQVDMIPNTQIHLNATAVDQSGKMLFVRSGGLITQPGRYSLSFTINDPSIASVRLSLSFAKNETATYSVKLGAEKLTLNGDTTYTPSYDTYTVQELSNELYRTLFNGGNIHYANVPFVNLLKGTSTEMATYSAKGYGSITTSKNAKEFFNIKKGGTYCYRITFGEVPSVSSALEISGFDMNGKNLWVVREPVKHAGDNSIIFEIPKDGTVRIQCCIVFSPPQDEPVEVTIGKESLSLSNFDNGYHEHPVLAAETMENVIEQISENTQDSHFLQKHLPIINIGGSSQDVGNVNTNTIFPVDFYHDGKKDSIYGSFAWQGDTSKFWPEKNFKFKAFKDLNGEKKLKYRPLPTFYKSHHFTLKAYYTDRYLVRDLVAAEIYSWFIASNPTAPKELLLANHFGTVQGTPVLVYIRGNFYGVFELNTKSSSNLWNMDEDNADQIAIQSKVNNDACKWETVPTYGTDFELDSDNETNAASALKKLSDALVGVDDETFKTNVTKMFDINSIADYYIFNRLINNTDCWGGKNVEYLTYDNGEHWFLMSYDFNTSMLQDWKPGMTGTPDRMLNISNLLVKRFVALFDVEIKARYAQLEQLGILNPINFCRELDKRVNEIGYDAYQMNEQRWPENESYAEKEHLDDIKHMFVLRKGLLDKMLK